MSESPLSEIIEIGQRALPELESLLEGADGELESDLTALVGALDRATAFTQAGTANRHDMLNALAAVKGYSEMVLELNSELSDAAREHLLTLVAAASAIAPTSEALSQAQNARAQTAQTQNVQRSSDTQTFEGCTLLVVDDLPENLDLMRRLLTKMKCEVLTADSGERALHILDTELVDLVLLDLVMPDTDGKAVLAQIKNSEKLRAIPVIMISGRQDMDQIIDCIQAGADDYLLKPVNAVLLTARIQSGIERKHWHDKESQYRDQLEKRELFIRQTFGRYISDAIVDEILEKPEGLKLGGDLRTVTLMMSDIRSFTTLVEHLPPEQVVALLNRYLGKMTDIILTYGGTIDEFMGDAVLAAFGAPATMADHASRAVTCALDMQAAMSDINALNRRDGLPEVEMAIALNTGEVVAGNIGSERRSKYGFVGHQVNVTSRIEDDAKPNEILISEQTVACLDTRRFIIGSSRRLNAKGIEEVLRVFPILGAQSHD